MKLEQRFLIKRELKLERKKIEYKTVSRETKGKYGVDREE